MTRWSSVPALAVGGTERGARYRYLRRFKGAAPGQFADPEHRHSVPARVSRLDGDTLNRGDSHMIRCVRNRGRCVPFQGTARLPNKRNCGRATRRLYWCARSCSMVRWRSWRRSTEAWTPLCGSGDVWNRAAAAALPSKMRQRDPARVWRARQRSSEALHETLERNRSEGAVFVEM